MNDSLIVVGASGRVGRMVLAAWQDNTSPAHRIVVQSRRVGTKLDTNTLRWDPMWGADALCDWVKQFGPLRVMVVLAGVTPKGDAELSLNTHIAEACLSAAAEAGIKRVLLASSSAVYGTGTAFTESVPCNPVNDYGHAKLAMERACTPWREKGIDLCCLRIGNVAGADALLLNIAKAAAAIEIDIFDDGCGPVRSYIGARTMAEVLQTLCLHPGALPSALNLAAPEPVSMDALADAAQHPWEPRAPSSNANQYITLDCSRLSSLHEFSLSDSQPAEMIRQWKDTIGS